MLKTHLFKGVTILLPVLRPIFDVSGEKDSDVGEYFCFENTFDFSALQ